MAGLNKAVAICLQNVRLWSPQLTTLRFRYHAEKIARGRLLRRFGYENPVLQSGMLPRIKDAEPLPMPKYRPKDAWSEKRALLDKMTTLTYWVMKDFTLPEYYTTYHLG